MLGDQIKEIISNDEVNNGDLCYVVGNPGGLDEDSISGGFIRDANYCEPSGYQITNSMYVNAPGMGGNSGGPIINKNGDVVGIYVWVRRRKRVFWWWFK